MKSIVKLLVLFLVLSTTYNPARAVQVEKFQCNYAQNPIGIDDPSPCLSSIITSQERGDEQTAYQIVVSSSTELLLANKGDLWFLRSENKAVVYQIDSGTYQFTAKQ